MKVTRTNVLTNYLIVPRLLNHVGAILVWGLSLASTHAIAAEKITICHAALITLPSFEQHVSDLRQAKRYEKEEIDKLIARQRKGGTEFFTSQIIFQESASGSGTYDLRLMHGLSGRHAKYHNITPWACDASDYPVAYFVGFRVEEVQDAQISVSRQRDVVSVISLQKIRKPTTVKSLEGGRVLCADIAVGCVDGIWFDGY